MIPKIIHYCWLSNDPIPNILQKYMESWKKYLPDYKFIKWDFTRFDKSTSVWVSEAFDNKKYAFAADYIRLYALYNYGGIYLDMDVEVLKPYTNEMLHLTTMICWERDGSGLEVAAFGVEKNSPWIKLCLDYYTNRHFIKANGTFETKVLPQVVKEILVENGYEIVNAHDINESLFLCAKNKIAVLPSEFFSPKSYTTGKIIITGNTYSIHHFTGSWLTTKEKLVKLLTRIFGGRIIRKIVNIKNILKYYGRH
jgi:hypothetical protein